MKILFCRHGETLWNKQGKLQGHLDSDLSKEGILQSRQLGQRLTEYQPELIISSDLGRAVSTAMYINESMNISTLSTSLLRERCFGELQGLLREEGDDRWHAYEQRFVANNMDIKKSESATAVLTRIEQFFGSIECLDVNTLVVIGHGEWLRVLQNVANGQAPWSNQLPVPGNCEYFEYAL